MATDAHLKITGPDVKGESPVKGHEGEIQVLAWSWGLSQTGTTHHGSGGGAGKVNVQDLSFTHHVDNSSPTLTLACCKGTHFNKAVLALRKAGGDPLPYMVLTMNDLIVTSVSGGGSGGEDQQTENVTLNFASFTLAYQPQDNKGAKKGGANEITYNIAQNA